MIGGWTAGRRGRGEADHLPYTHGDVLPTWNSEYELRRALSLTLTATATWPDLAGGHVHVAVAVNAHDHVDDADNDHAPLRRRQNLALAVYPLPVAAPWPPVRPDGPDDPSRPRRLDWAALLKRVRAVDVLVCPRCAGPMRIVALIEDEVVAGKILAHLGLPSRAPPRGRPWRPGQQFLPDHARPFLDGVDPPAFAD